MIMLPTHIASLDYIDIYRDGGSLGIGFEGEDKNSYSLFFPVRLHNTSSGLEKSGYLKPSLEITFPSSEWTSKVTGEIHINYESKKRGISWIEAREILAMMKELVEDFQGTELFKNYNQELGLSYYSDMVFATETKGELRP
jgi:hypothetical protein